MQRQRLGFLFLLACSAVLTLSACKNNDSPLKGSSSASGSTPAIDTTEKAKEVQITEKDHHILFRPKQGTSQRYHVISKQTTASDAEDQLGGKPREKHGIEQNVDYFIRQTYKSTKPDSSVEMTCRIESITMHSTIDTAKISYSSSNANDLKNSRFDALNLVLNQDLVVVISKHGIVLDVTNLAPIVNKVLPNRMGMIPDSLRSNPAVKQEFEREITQGLKQTIAQLLEPISPSLPDRAIGKDSSWSESADFNIPVDDKVQFPAIHSVRTVVKGFEERNDDVLAVIDVTSSSKPAQNVIEQAGAKANLSNFQDITHIVNRVDDATGVLVQRTLDQKKALDFSLESGQQPGKSFHTSQSFTSTTSVELLK